MSEPDLSPPEITVVIPVYNGSNYLHEAIDSVLHQSYRNFEILVVDDGSKDDTWSVIEKYMAAYPGVVRGIRKTNGGTSSALNAGILDARGKYFAWLSHDDRFVPTKLEKQMQLIREKPEIVGVYSDYSRIDPAGQKICDSRCAWFPGKMKLRYLLWDCFIHGSTLLIERRCLIEMGLFDVNMLYAQELMMWGDLVMHYELGYIRESLTEYRIHQQQTTQSTKRKIVSNDVKMWRKKIVDTYTIQQIFPELERPDVAPREIAIAHCDLARLFIIYLSDYAMGYKQFWRAWQAWPDLRNPVLGHVSNETKNVLLRKARKSRWAISQKVRNLLPGRVQSPIRPQNVDSDLTEIFAGFHFATAKDVSRQ